MMLQKICDTVGGRSEPVRRKRYAQWNPNRLVYAVWNTVRHRMGKNKRKKGGVGPTRRQESNASGGRRPAIAVVCIPRMVKVRCRKSGQLATGINADTADIPTPNASGVRKIILVREEPAMWYTASMHALNTTSSVIGPWRKCMFKNGSRTSHRRNTYHDIISDPHPSRD